jgi:thiamine biosynthesis protein ThiC
MVEAAQCDERIVLPACEEVTKGRIGYRLKRHTSDFATSVPSFRKAQKFSEGLVFIFFFTE